MINVGDPHQIAGLFDTYDHNIRLILNGRDRNPELTVEFARAGGAPIEFAIENAL